MKRLFFLLAIIILAASCRKNKPDTPPPPPVSKQVSFAVFAGQDYSNNAQSPNGYKAASVKLIIEKMLHKTGGLQPVWDTTFSYRSLTEYPLQPQRYQVQKQIPVLESKEELHVRYEVVYGSLYDVPQPFGFQKTIPTGEVDLHVNVEL